MRQQSLILFFFCCFSLHSEDALKHHPTEANEGYTINYDTVSIIEYIRFASKICNMNFIFNEADLDFTVTVVSDAPITPQNIMATLLQVLRIHGLSLLEQDNNLVIHKSAEVMQIATLVTDETQENNAPIVTRIFRVKVAKVDAVAGIIRPMISASALLEVLPETKQMILTDVTANVDKVANLIEILDSPLNQLGVKAYTALHNSPQQLVELASQIMAPMALGNPFILVPQPMTNAIFIVSTGDLIEKTLAILANLDVVPKAQLLSQKQIKGEMIFVYKATTRSSDELLHLLTDIGKNLQKSGIPEGDLIQTIESAQSIGEANSIMFVGSKDAIAKVKEFLTALDVSDSRKGVSALSFFVYRPKNKAAKEIVSSLKEMADNLKTMKGTEENFIHMLQSAKVNHTTNTILLSGDESHFAQVKDLLLNIDTPTANKGLSAKHDFFLYQAQKATARDLNASLKAFAKNLDKSNIQDEGLIQTIEEMKLIPDTNSILFAGPDSTLKRLQEILPSFDASLDSVLLSNQFFIYKPKYQKGEQLEKSIKEVAQDLAMDQFLDPAFLRSLESMKYVKNTGSLLFTGDAASLKRLEELIATIDVPTTALSSTKPGYYIYKLKSAVGDAIEEDLDILAKDLKANGSGNEPLFNVIHNIRYIQETNSLLLTGDAAAIDEVKAIIAEYDYPRTEQSHISSNFFMYKPQHQSALQIEKSLQDIASNLKKANLADPALLKTIDSVKYVEATNSLIFTGNSESIQKLQTLLPEIDTPPKEQSRIQHIGKTTFLLYKLKVASGPQVITSIQAMAADLQKSKHASPDLISALNSAKFVKETNSLFFTGTEEALQQAQTLVEQFDVTSLATPLPVKQPQSGQTNFYLYTPLSLPASELAQLMNDFAANLHSSGLSDPDLFSAISSMRLLAQTQSLVFTGTPKALEQIKDLLKTFDIPANLQSQTPNASLSPSIQAIDNTSFLVYKLQFHKGDEIQGALKQIAKDLMSNNAPINHNLLNSITSIQWLDVTNSLLCSGDQATLTRLKELIKNLDIPLKQVFIEVLVVETSLTNALLFGLEWGGNYKFNDKFGISSFNTIPPVNTQSGFPDTFVSKLSGLMPPSPPTPIGNIPPITGFDLGVIGEVIKHNGNTFLTLGSLLSALQSDTETTIITAPKLLGQDGRTSTIFSGANIPFTGSFVNNTTNGATVLTSNIEYRDIGLNLTITPVLGNSDIVTLDISLDRSQTATNITQSQLNFQSQTANGIVTSKTTMQTTVHVPDRNFLVLSGFVNNSTTKAKQGIPCLGGLPMIGAAFSQQNDTISNQNVVIFLRPFIINSIDDMRRITSDQEDVFRDLANTPFLEHNYDDAVELIKSIDDE
ncbi:MAG TPA: secretin N-terminal domain-containing protein [Chlamydiales bacterium]|nr:secretin N-terminal domain-containing protein [Chlamydiales bacterium]